MPITQKVLLIKFLNDFFFKHSWHKIDFESQTQALIDDSSRVKLMKICLLMIFQQKSSLSHQQKSSLSHSQNSITDVTPIFIIIFNCVVPHKLQKVRKYISSLSLKFIHSEKATKFWVRVKHALTRPHTPSALLGPKPHALSRL